MTPGRYLEEEDEGNSEVARRNALAALAAPPEPPAPPAAKALPKDDAMAAAMSLERENALGAGLSRAGAMASAALTRRKFDPSMWDARALGGTSPVQALVAQRAADAERAKAARQAELADPNSSESIRQRAAIKAAIPGLPDDVVDGLTAADADSVFERLKFGATQANLREARVDALAQRAEQAESAREDRRLARELAAGRHADEQIWRTEQNALNRASREKNAAVLAHDKDEQQRLTREGEMRREVQGHPVVRAYQEAAVSFDKMLRAAADQSAAGDLALIFAYMKTLDPGSTVREGEFANAQNAAGIPERIRNAWNKGLSGERLSPEQRQEFLRNARSSFAAQKQRADSLIQGYSKVAEESGVSPGRVVVPGTNVDIDLSSPPAAPPPSGTKPQKLADVPVLKLQPGQRAADVIPEGEFRRVPMGGGAFRLVVKRNGKLKIVE